MSYFWEVHHVDAFKKHNRERRRHAKRMNFGLKPKFKSTGNLAPRRHPRAPNNNPSTRGKQMKTHK